MLNSARNKSFSDLFSHGLKFSGLFLVSLKILNSADNNSFSDLVSVSLKVFDH